MDISGGILTDKVPQIPVRISGNIRMILDPDRGSELLFDFGFLLKTDHESELEFDSGFSLKTDQVSEL